MMPVWLVLLISVSLAWPTWAAQETLQMSATGTLNAWTLVGAATKVLAVNSPDNDATSYIHSTTVSGTQQQFAVANTTSAIESGATINFVRLRARCIRGGGQNATFLLTAVLSASTTDGTTQTAAATYANFTNDFTTRPGGGSWTKTDVDNFEFRVRNTQARQVNCTTLEAIIDYTNPAPPANLLLAQWSLNETSGTSAADATGGGFTGTLCQAGTCPSAGFNTWTTGKIVGALDFDGSNDHVQVSHHATLNTTASMTAWIRPDVVDVSAGPNRGIVNKGDYTAAGAFFLMLKDWGSVLLCDIGNAAHGTDSIKVDTSGNLSVGQWHLIACVADATGHQLFINDVSVATNARAKGTVNNTAALQIGQVSVWLDSPFDGVIDDVRLYNYRLSLAEVQSLYAAAQGLRRRGSQVNLW